MIKKLKIGFQYILPKHLVSRLVGKLAAAEAGFITTLLIRIFIKAFGINMQEAKHTSPTAYKTFNAFFTRPLADGARPLFEQKETFVHPVDGCVSQLGDITEGQLIQAKGHQYSVKALLGGSEATAAPFKAGKFATIYLAPKDYHRIHMPLDGVLKEMIYVPGELFSVNPLTAENVPGLFARNERVVAIFDSELGPFAMVLVGATIVASIETVWAGTVTPPAASDIKRWDYSTLAEPISLKKGAEMGRFKLGSTVVMCFPHNSVDFLPENKPTTPTSMGEHFGNIIKQ